MWSNEQTTDPITFHTMLLKDELGKVDRLASVLRLGIVGVSTVQRDEMSMRLAKLAQDRFIFPQIQRAEDSTRDLFHGTRYVGVSNKHVREILELWEGQFKTSVGTKYRTSWEAYASIAEILGTETITKFGVKKIVLAHQKRKQSGVHNEA